MDGNKKRAKLKFVSYGGEWPNLCHGGLVLRLGREKYVFPPGCLRSGGSVCFDEHWNEEITQGPWTIIDWPEDFPEDRMTEAVELVNDNVPHGCCGGCV